MTKLITCGLLGLLATALFADPTSDWNAYWAAESQARQAPPSAAPILYRKAAQLLSTYLNRYFTSTTAKNSQGYARGLFALGNDYWSGGDLTNAQNAFSACEKVTGATQVIVNGLTLKDAAIQSTKRMHTVSPAVGITSITVNPSKD